MEELNDLNNKIIDEIQNTEMKNIIIETKETLTPEQRMAIDTIRRVKHPFRMLGVKDVMRDLNICETIAYKTFKRDDFPSINIGKSNQVMLLSYLIWKMSKRIQVVVIISNKEKSGSVYYDKERKKMEMYLLYL